MDDETTGMRVRVRIGWLLVVTGFVVVLGSAVLRNWNAFPGWTGAVGGLGIVAGCIGGSLLGRYRSAVRDPAAARRVMAVERDERTASIRTRAGHRAWVVSAVITWIG